MSIAITVFTPTYNRSTTLGRLFDSLQKQSDKDFEWLIVDDGSKDNTGELVSKFKNDAKFEIRYYYKKNEGKHIAINYGVNKARGRLFFIVDSDDALTEDAISEIKHYENGLSPKIKYAGVAGLKGNFEKKPIKSAAELYEEKELKKMADTLDATQVEYNYHYKITGDRAQAVYTDVMKLFPFPKIADEKFMEESYLWNGLSKAGYKFRWFKKVIYLCEYRPDGLTQNMREIVKKNWRTHCFCANFDLTIHGIPLKEKMRECIRYYRYGFWGEESIGKLFACCNSKILSVPSILIALLFPVK